MPKRDGRPSRLEICILAGGRSSRMGRDKAGLRLGRRSLLSHIRHTARQMGVPVRVVRRDAVARCGPLGGVFTGLKRSRFSAVLFLSCDMPFVSAALLKRVVRSLRAETLGVFAVSKAPDAGHPQFPVKEEAQRALAGFPFAIRRDALSRIDQLIREGKYSLQHLAAALDAVWLELPGRYQPELFNINTREDWNRAKARWKATRGTRAANGRQNHYL